MKHTLKISIVIPSFNQGQFLEETIQSVINQSYKNYELILIDGGSSDETLNVIKKYESYFSYWISEKDNGQSEAINKGLKFATGDIVTWLNSDDYYENGALEKITELFYKNPDTDIIHGKSRFFGDKIKSQIVGVNVDLSIADYLAFMRFPQPSSFFRKDFLGPTCGVNEHLHYTMDFELVARALLSGAHIKKTDQLLSHYRLHQASKSNQEINFIREWTIVVSAILRSIESGDRFIEEMDSLNLLASDLSYTYIFRNEINFSDPENIFLEHLHLHYHYHYRMLNYDECRKISEFLKKNYSSFYRKNNYNKYNFRLKFIPRFIFNLVRQSNKAE